METLQHRLTVFGHVELYQRELANVTEDFCSDSTDVSVNHTVFLYCPLVAIHTQCTVHHTRKTSFYHVRPDILMTFQLVKGLHKNSNVQLRFYYIIIFQCIVNTEELRRNVHSVILTGRQGDKLIFFLEFIRQSLFLPDPFPTTLETCCYRWLISPLAYPGH